MQNQDTDKVGFSYTYSGPYKAGINVAKHYGFELIPTIKGEYSLRNELGARHPSHRANYLDPVHKILIHEHIALEGSARSAQFMVCHSRSPRKKDDGGINLHIIGNSKSISEALAIKSALSILGEYGHKDMFVEINSMGDRITNKVFTKELINHYRKNISLIGDCCRTHMKNNPFLLAVCRHEECSAIRSDAPRPLSFLSEVGREHLKNIIEYLESMGVMYRINNHLIGEYPESGTQVAFVIKDGTSDADSDEASTIARGERYNRYTHKNQTKKVPPSVGVSIDIGKSGKEKYRELSEESPSVYLVHLGIEAKRKSLDILEMFRQKNMPLAQSLIYDDLTRQMQRAEQIRAKYVIIIGLKEARERAVIVRNTATRAENIVSLDNLLRYMNHIHKL